MELPKENDYPLKITGDPIRMRTWSVFVDFRKKKQETKKEFPP